MRLAGCITTSAIRSPSSLRIMALGERTQFGMAPGEPGTGSHAGRMTLPEALAALCSTEGRHSLPEKVDRPTIIAMGMIGEAEILIRQCVQGNLTAGRGEREGALGGGMAWSYAPMR